MRRLHILHKYCVYIFTYTYMYVVSTDENTRLGD